MKNNYHNELKRVNGLIGISKKNKCCLPPTPAVNEDQCMIYNNHGNGLSAEGKLNLYATGKSMNVYTFKEGNSPFLRIPSNRFVQDSEADSFLKINCLDHERKLSGIATSSSFSIFFDDLKKSQAQTTFFLNTSYREYHNKNYQCYFMEKSICAYRQSSAELSTIHEIEEEADDFHPRKCKKQERHYGLNGDSCLDNVQINNLNNKPYKNNCRCKASLRDPNKVSNSPKHSWVSKCQKETNFLKNDATLKQQNNVKMRLANNVILSLIVEDNNSLDTCTCCNNNLQKDNESLFNRNRIISTIELKVKGKNCSPTMFKQESRIRNEEKHTCVCMDSFQKNAGTIVSKFTMQGVTPNVYLPMLVGNCIPTTCQVFKTVGFKTKIVDHIRGEKQNFYTQIPSNQNIPQELDGTQRSQKHHETMECSNFKQYCRNLNNSGVTESHSIFFVFHGLNNSNNGCYREIYCNDILSTAIICLHLSRSKQNINEHRDVSCACPSTKFPSLPLPSQCCRNTYFSAPVEVNKVKNYTAINPSIHSPCQPLPGHSSMTSNPTENIQKFGPNLCTLQKYIQATISQKCAAIQQPSSCGMTCKAVSRMVTTNSINTPFDPTAAQKSSTCPTMCTPRISSPKITTFFPPSPMKFDHSASCTTSSTWSNRSLKAKCSDSSKSVSAQEKRDAKCNICKKHEHVGKCEECERGKTNAGQIGDKEAKNSSTADNFVYTEATYEDLDLLTDDYNDLKRAFEKFMTNRPSKNPKCTYIKKGF